MLWRGHLVCIFIDKCAGWSLFYQDVWCLLFTFSFWSLVACFFSLLRFVVEEDCWLAVSSVPSRHFIGCTRWNGDNTSKNKLCDLQVLKDIWCHFTTDISYFRPYAETKNIYGTQHWRILWSSYRKLAWVGFEPTTTEFHSEALTNWAIRPWVQLALRANFLQPLQFHCLFSVKYILYARSLRLSIRLTFFVSFHIEKYKNGAFYVWEN